MDKEQNMNNNVDWKQWIPFSKSTSALWRPLKPKNNAVAIWPVTGQGVENTKWPAVLYSQQISQNRKILANLNYHMLI